MGQPVREQRFLPRIMDAQQIYQTAACTGGGIRRSGRRAVKTQFCGGRFLGEGLDQVQLAHFQCREAFAQCRLQGVFPTRFDVQAAPQRLQIVQTVATQPGAELLVCFDPFLQGFQSLQAG